MNEGKIWFSKTRVRRNIENEKIVTENKMSSSRSGEREREREERERERQRERERERERERQRDRERERGERHHTFPEDVQVMSQMKNEFQPFLLVEFLILVLVNLLIRLSYLK